MPSEYLIALIGAAFGAAAAWLACQPRCREYLARLGERDREVANLRQQLGAETQRREREQVAHEEELQATRGELTAVREERQGTVARLEARLEERDRDVRNLREQLQAETEKREHESVDSKAQLEALSRDVTSLREERARATADLEAERKARAEAATAFEQFDARLRDAFGALASQALQYNNQTFLDLAKTKFSELRQSTTADFEARQARIDQMVQPIQDGLTQIKTKLQEFDHIRTSADSRIQELLGQMTASQQQLRSETQNLVTALRTPQGRGQWGEMQLRRVVELAGMVEHCDFVEQETYQADGHQLRPDLLVRLPGEKIVVVDSKAPLLAYLDALDARDEITRRSLLEQHAEQVRTHVLKLAEKGYARELAEAPDFVVLFLPGEAFFSAACLQDPALLEFAIGKGVIPASPTTLVTLLKAVAYGWKQERVAQNAEDIRQLGQTLHDRIRVFAEHLVKLRKGLASAVTAYNGAVGSLENRVMPAARKFRDLDVGEDEIEFLDPVDEVPRPLAAPELRTEADVDEYDNAEPRTRPEAA